MKAIAIILAAGQGTRMKSNLPKILHKVNGIPMVKQVIKELDKAKVEKNILVLGHKIDEVLEELGEVEYVVQNERLGTGHAVMQAEEKLKDYDGIVVVLCGDTPLITAKTIDMLINEHINNKEAATVLTTDFENPFGYGRIVKNTSGNIEAIVEEKEATEEIKAIKEVNTGVYCFDSKKLFKALHKVGKNNEKGEYYLTDVVKILKENGENVKTHKISDNKEVYGVNSKVHLSTAESILKDRKNMELMESGVTLIDPSTTYIEMDVKIGKDSIIYPGAIIQGNTVIGENVTIIGNSRIVNSEISANVVIESSVIEESVVEEGVTIGPFAHLRPKAYLKKNVHIGNFVEIKKSTLEKGVKAGHLTYIGDSEIGEDTNIGAGTITCNYDGKNKFKTIIGKDVFVGSNTKFVAPVVIGDNVLIAAGSTITEDVSKDSLAIARARQVVKDGYLKKIKKS
ncbi:bifunctional UDP-N-acetylglucosamine diphosphorylase/glucosamine-1-phosphate N-acetyltransferase GlmU [Haliovirga abyssi]|uniref:Bifunctional protein GlmU n=1 Tax=Haliovirga abyssi TaxID=2996794 RepID=A0AAU9DGW2_9FUSO|nr:bifunctional UDP-N-acetylglucosamine diphosphorylase/glucosamine-1-phosphate N-acetyltransferase GlmU [Haliovirga abyssi]BDU50707.1 bifunctional protein GlmU [Haliovirga abyssi]